MQKQGDLPSAIFTISKNVLGRNVTDMVVKPLVSLGSGKVVSQDNRPCSTPDGAQGNCEDLSNCPQLLLNLGHLRQSICFKNLFVPGVCCPKKTPEQWVCPSYHGCCILFYIIIYSVFLNRIIMRNRVASCAFQYEHYLQYLWMGTCLYYSKQNIIELYQKYCIGTL